MVSDCCSSVAFVTNSLKNQNFVQAFFINFAEIDDYKHCFICIFIK